MMKLYSVSRNDSTPILVTETDGGYKITSVGDFKWSEHTATINALQEGESTVQGIKRPESISYDTSWRITRLPEYRANRVVFDESAKEHVIVTNGKCVLDHADSKAFQTSHTVNCPGSGTLTAGDGQRVATCYQCKRTFAMAAMSDGALIVPGHFNTNHCQYAPSEAIALRVFVGDTGKVSVAWTYRGVNPVYLRPVKADTESSIKEQFQAVMSKRRSARFIGRV